jgi:hypothetical protein
MIVRNVGENICSGKINKMLVNYKEILEALRQSGKRDEFLKLRDEIQRQEDAEKQKKLQDKCEAEYQRIIAEYPIGVYSPEARGTIEKIEKQCGTKYFSIDIYFKGNPQAYTYSEIKKNYYEAKQRKEYERQFRLLKLSDKKNSILIGKDYEETIAMILANMDMKLPSWESIDDDFESETYSYIFKKSVEDGYSDETAEEKAQEVEVRERDEYYKQWKNAIESAIESVLSPHGLTLICEDKGKYSIGKTCKTWKEVAENVIDTINGVGMFYFNNVEEFKSCGPYKSYCEAVFNHIHWMCRRSEVYGDRGYQSVYENSWR